MTTPILIHLGGPNIRTDRVACTPVVKMPRFFIVRVRAVIVTTLFYNNLALNLIPEATAKCCM